MTAELPPRLDAAVRSVASRLAKAGIEPAFTEARLIFELAGFDRMALLKAPDEMLNADQRSVVLAAIEQRLTGMPVARIRGSVMFDGRFFALGPDTLEPRDDTLTLIDAVTEFVQQTPDCRILDIGIGSGIIALTLLSRAQEATALATDISASALGVAQQNAESLQLSGHFKTLEADMLAGVEGRFDLIISNPPYIKSADIAGLEREVRDHDPVIALDGGDDGLDFYRAISMGAGALLSDNGQVAVEIGFDQRHSVAALFLAAGFKELAFHADLGGRARALVFAKV